MAVSRHRSPSIFRGAILWLPARRFVKEKWRNLPRDVFDHPVLVYNIRSPEKADIFLLTSFDAGKSLIGRFRRDPDFRSRQVPITPAPKHPDHGVLLTLANGRQWLKESYVSIKLFTVPFGVLREEQQGPWALNEESMQALDDYIATMPTIPTWKRSSQLENGAPERLLEKTKVDHTQDVAEEEGWITVSRNRKRGPSVGVKTAG